MGIADIAYVREVARLLHDLQLNRIEVQEDGARLLIERPPQASAVFPSPAAPAEAPKCLPQAAQGQTEVKAPLVGVFYSAPAPDADPFVRIGDEVKAGDVLCIIEAMKLLNEITAETDGRIMDICLKNGDIAEYGQVLFVLGDTSQ